MNKPCVTIYKIHLWFISVSIQYSEFHKLLAIEKRRPGYIGYYRHTSESFSIVYGGCTICEINSLSKVKWCLSGHIIKLCNVIYTISICIIWVGNRMFSNLIVLLRKSGKRLRDYHISIYTHSYGSWRLISKIRLV